MMIARPWPIVLEKPDYTVQRNGRQCLRKVSRL